MNCNPPHVTETTRRRYQNQLCTRGHLLVWQSSLGSLPAMPPMLVNPALCGQDDCPMLTTTTVRPFGTAEAASAASASRPLIASSVTFDLRCPPSPRWLRCHGLAVPASRPPTHFRHARNVFLPGYVHPGLLLPNGIGLVRSWPLNSWGRWLSLAEAPAALASDWHVWVCWGSVAGDGIRGLQCEHSV